MGGEKRARDEKGVGSTLSEKVSSVRVMTSAPDRTVRAASTVRDTSRRWIRRRPRRGATGSMARMDGDGEEREGNEEVRIRCDRARVMKSMACIFWAFMGREIFGLNVWTYGPPLCLSGCSPVLVRKRLGTTARDDF